MYLYLTFHLYYYYYYYYYISIIITDIIIDNLYKVDPEILKKRKTAQSETGKPYARLHVMTIYKDDNNIDMNRSGSSGIATHQSSAAQGIRKVDDTVAVSNNARNFSPNREKDRNFGSRNDDRNRSYGYDNSRDRNNYRDDRNFNNDRNKNYGSSNDNMNRYRPPPAGSK